MTDSMQIETIDRQGLERAQKRLLPKPHSGARGGLEQREFLRLAAGDGTEFCRLVKLWGLRQGRTPAVTDIRLSERELLDPPWSTERKVAATWANLPVNLAARPETWTRIHVEMVDQGLMKSSYLAANGGESGKGRIARALNGTDSQLVDDCVRTVLRRLGGVIEARANRTSFLDCPLARAWWRHRYATEAHKCFGCTTIEDLSAALRQRFRWEALVEAMVSKLTVIGDSAIRPAIVQCMADGAGSTRQEVENMLGWIGRRTTVQALGALDPNYVRKLIAEQFLDSGSQEAT